MPNSSRPPETTSTVAAIFASIAGGRLEFGIGAGSRPDVPFARREYEAYGLPYHDAAYAVGSLAEACTIIRRMWTEDKPFDFDGAYYQLTGAWCNPKPLQRPYPPIVIGGRSRATLRVVAQHADVWNMPGGELDDAVQRSELLDRLCAEVGREPASITRSIPLPVSYDEPAATRDAIRGAVGAGFTHVVLSLRSPYPDGVAQWVADEVIRPST